MTDPSLPPRPSSAAMEKSSLREGAIILLVCLYTTFVKVIFMSIGDARIFPFYGCRSSYVRSRKMKEKENKRHLHPPTHRGKINTSVTVLQRYIQTDSIFRINLRRWTQVDFPSCQSTKGSDYYVSTHVVQRMVPVLPGMDKPARQAHLCVCDAGLLSWLHAQGYSGCLHGLLPFSRTTCKGCVCSSLNAGISWAVD